MQKLAGIRGISVVILSSALAAAGSACTGGTDTDLFSSKSSGSGGDTGSGGTGGTGGMSSSSASSSSSSASSSSSGTGGVLDPGVISGSPLSSIESETHVAAAPNGLVAVAWIAIKQGGNSTNGYVFSTNGGASFGPVAEVPSPGGRVASDPVIAVDAQNNFYMTWVGYKVDAQGNASDMHIYVSIAPTGSTTFGAAIEVSNPNLNTQYDKPWIAVTNKNTLIITYARTATGGIYAARSTNQGQSWSIAVIAEDGNFRNLVYPCPPLNGNRIYATYHAGGGVGMRWSDDDGVTWPDANKIAVAAQNEQPAFMDPTCASEGNEVWISYGLSNDPFGNGGGTTMQKLNHIRIAHTSDGGPTIDSRVDAQDASAGAFFLLPQLVREPGGALNLVYYAGNQDNDTNGSYRRARSTNGGLTWAPSTVVHAPITFLQARDSPKWLGDYVGLWYLSGNLFTSYVNNTTPESHVAFAKMAVP